MKHVATLLVLLAATGVGAEERKTDPVRVPAVVDLKNKRCPIKGGKADGKTYADWNGVRVHFCCPGCDKKFRADPAAALKKLGLKVVELDGGKRRVVDLANEKCPIRGGRTRADGGKAHGGVLVRYCCPGCDRKLEKDPVKAFATLGYEYVPSYVDLRNTLCPLSGEPVDGKTHADFDGIRVQFCCPGCERRFGKDIAAGFKALGVEPAKLKAQVK